MCVHCVRVFASSSQDLERQEWLHFNDGTVAPITGEQLARVFGTPDAPAPAASPKASEGTQGSGAGAAGTKAEEGQQGVAVATVSPPAAATSAVITPGVCAWLYAQTCLQLFSTRSH